jgi:hypothetical protein
VPRDHDEQLLTARLVTSRHPGRWGTKFLGQISSTPVGFVTDKGSPKWGVAGRNEITTSTLNPAPTF